MHEKIKKEKVAELVTLLLEMLLEEGQPEDLDKYESEMEEIEQRIKELAINKSCMGAFWSDDFNRPDGSFDIDGFVEWCFQEPSVIAL